MNRKIVIGILAALFLASFISILPVHYLRVDAQSYLTYAYCGTNAAASCTSAGVSMTAGDTLIFQVYFTSSANDSCTTASVNDSQGDIYTQLGSTLTLNGNPSNTAATCMSMWSATVKSSASTTFSGGCHTDCLNVMQLLVGEFSGLGSFSSTSTGNCSSATATCNTFSVSPSVSYSAGDELIGFAYFSTSTPSGFTAYGFSLQGFYEFPSGSGSTSFSGSTDGSVYSGAILALFTPPTSTFNFVCTSTNGSPTVALSGGSVSPTSAGCSTSGTTTSITASTGATVTATVPANSTNLAYAFQNGGGTGGSTTTTDVASSSTWSVTIYQQIENSYIMDPTSPSSWDASYTEHGSGYDAGVSGVSLCSFSLTTSSGSVTSSCWSDYNKLFSVVSSFSSSVSGTWSCTGTCSWTDTTGGNSHTADYDLGGSGVIVPLDCTTLEAAPAGTITISAASGTVSPSTVTCLDTGTSTNLIVSSGGTTLTATKSADGTYTRYRFNVGGSPSNTTTFVTCDSGTCGTWVVNVYYELENTYESTTNGNGPPDWDSGLTSQTISGTVVGVSDTTLGTLSFVANTTVPASGTFWADYDLTVQGWGTTIGGAATNVRWITGDATGYEETTGGNTINVQYYKQLDNSYGALPSLPSGWDGNYVLDATGYFEGVSGSTICTISLPDGGTGIQTCTAYADYNENVSLPKTFASVVSGTWTAQTPYSWVFTSGGNTQYATYSLAAAGNVTFSVVCTLGYSNVEYPTITISVSTGPITPTSFTCNDQTHHPFTANSGASLIFTNPADGATSRYRFTGGVSSLTYTVSNSTYSFDDYQQLLENFRWTPPVACSVCSGQVPEITYDAAAASESVNLAAAGDNTNPTAYTSFWADNQSDWIAQNPIFYDLQQWSPNATSGTFSTAKDYTLTYTQFQPIESNACGPTPISSLQLGQWLCGSAQTYGDLIGMSWFFGILIMEIVGMIYLKSGNAGLTILVLLVSFGIFGVGANALTGGNFLPGPLAILGFAVTVVAIAGILWKLFAGGGH